MLFPCLFTSLFVTGLLCQVVTQSAAQQPQIVEKLRQASKRIKIRPQVRAQMNSMFDSPFWQAREMYRAINEADYECDYPPLLDFIDVVYGRLTQNETDAVDALNDLAVFAWPTYAVLINGRSPAADVFYPNKQQGTEYQKRFKDLQKFWDVYTKDISVFALSGQMLRDDAYIIPAIQYINEVNRTEAQELIDFVQEAFATYPAIGYNFPDWSLNAFAAKPNFPEFKGDGSIAMGDGVTMFMEFAGIQDAGPDAVFFHEFGHHIQYGLNFPEINIPPEESTPEITRYIELMADAYSAYFAHHPRGASFQTKRIVEVSRALYGVGDCNFNFTGHHGTPNQREKAAQFAVKVVEESKGKGKIPKAAEFKAKFDAAYSGIIAPDKAK